VCERSRLDTGQGAGLPVLPPARRCPARLAAGRGHVWGKQDTEQGLFPSGRRKYPGSAWWGASSRTLAANLPRQG